MLDSLKPGQMITCTVTAMPRAEGSVKTIERLMKMNPEVKKGLRRAHKKRMQNWTVYNRGNRDWVKRERCGKIAKAAAGSSWTMPFDLNIAADLKSVEKYLKVAQA